MTCCDAISLLAEYLDATLTADSGAELEAHLRDCRPCQAYLKTYKRTRDVAATAGRVTMPEEMQARLRRFLLSTLGDSQS